MTRLPVPLLSVAAFLALWALAAAVAASPDTLPAPWTVARLTIAELASDK